MTLIKEWRSTQNLSHILYPEILDCIVIMALKNLQEKPIQTEILLSELENNNSDQKNTICETLDDHSIQIQEIMFKILMQMASPDLFEIIPVDDMNPEKAIFNYFCEKMSFNDKKEVSRVAKTSLQYIQKMKWNKVI